MNKKLYSMNNISEGDTKPKNREIIHRDEIENAILELAGLLDEVIAEQKNILVKLAELSK